MSWKWDKLNEDESEREKVLSRGLWQVEIGVEWKWIRFGLKVAAGMSIDFSPIVFSVAKGKKSESVCEINGSAG
jgi:hypothetical protein